MAGTSSPHAAVGNMGPPRPGTWVRAEPEIGRPALGETTRRGETSRDSPRRRKRLGAAHSVPLLPRPGPPRFTELAARRVSSGANPLALPAKVPRLRSPGDFRRGAAVLVGRR